MSRIIASVANNSFIIEIAFGVLPLPAIDSEAGFVTPLANN